MSDLRVIADMAVQATTNALSEDPKNRGLLLSLRGWQKIAAQQRAPRYCPIGMDANPSVCSAGTCQSCRRRWP